MWVQHLQQRFGELRVIVLDALAGTRAEQGEGFDQYHKQTRQMFDKVQMRKPLSSRDRSREQYLLARGFRGA